MDAAFIAKCADPNLAPAIVERFVAAVGSQDPLAVSVQSGGHLVLVPKPRSPDEALEVVRSNVGRAVVRVGITQFPAGIDVADVSQLQIGIFDACENLQRGTALFAKVARIVTKWYGRPTNTEILPHMLEDAIYAWKTGTFEGDNVFRADDPGGPTFVGKPLSAAEPTKQLAPPHFDHEDASQSDKMDKAAKAGIRIDLSGISGK